MCGIIGQVGGVLPQDLPLDHLAHRGPDAEGLWTNARNCVLGHRRLSILDLSERANQPMVDSSRRFVVVFNGEIYNFEDLRREHLSGETLRTDSDTEVLLLLWRRMGPACLRLLRGMFAFAIWDNGQNRLWLARDHFGQKPLVYHLANGTLTFASELNALRHCTPDLAIDPVAVDLFLGYQSVPAPHTIYRNTFKLPAGHYALWDGQALTIERYWRLTFPPRARFRGEEGRKVGTKESRSDFLPSYLPTFLPSASSADCATEAQAAERLEDQIRRSVRSCLRADVPVGCLLSGGVDSSLVTALAAQESSTRLQTFSVGFEEPAYDERKYAEEVAARYGTDHHGCVLSVQDSQRYLERAVTQYGEPYGDSSALPTLMVCEMASRRLKVVLSGDGGDELLAGYEFFRPRWGDNFLSAAVVSRYRLGRRLGRLRSSVEPQHAAAKLLKRASAWACPLNRVLVYEHYVRQSDRPVLYAPGFLDSVHAARDRYEESLLAQVDARTDFLNQMLAVHCHGYLADDLLVKTDIASMAFGLEVRVPLLDHTLMQFAGDLPVGLKYRGGVGKYLLKKVARRYLPDSLLYRPKRGFSVPVKAWMKNGLGSRLREMGADRGHPLWEFLRSQVVLQWLERHRAGRADHGKRLWVILMLGLWLEKQGIRKK